MYTYEIRERNLKCLLNISEYLKAALCRLCLTNPNIFVHNELLVKKLQENHEFFIKIREFLIGDADLFYELHKRREFGINCIEFACCMSIESLLLLSHALLKAIEEYTVSLNEIDFLHSTILPNDCYHFNLHFNDTHTEINTPREWLFMLHAIPHFTEMNLSLSDKPDCIIEMRQEFVQQMELYLNKLCTSLTIPLDLQTDNSDCYLCERDRLSVGLIEHSNRNCHCITIPFSNSNTKGGVYSQYTTNLMNDSDTYQRILCLQKTPCCIKHKNYMKEKILFFKESKISCHDYAKL